MYSIGYMWCLVPMPVPGTFATLREAILAAVALDRQLGNGDLGISYVEMPTAGRVLIGNGAHEATR